MEEPQPIYPNDKFRIEGLAISKNSLCVGYNINRSTLLRWMRRGKMKITPDKKLTPKEIKKLTDLVGEPDWLKVRMAESIT